MKTRNIFLPLLLYGSNAAAFAPTSKPHDALTTNDIPSTTTATTTLFATAPNYHTRGPSQKRYYKREHYGYDNNSSSNEDSAEISRLRSQLHYVKGQVAEANLRATAAERRVALLSPENNNGGIINGAYVENTNSKVNDGEIQKMKKQEASLRKQTNELKSEIKQLQQKMESQSNELQKVKDKLVTSTAQNAELQNKNQKIQEESEQKLYDLETSYQREQYTLSRVTTSLRKELDDYKTSYRAKLAQFKSDQQELTALHEKEMKVLEGSMNQLMLKQKQDYENQKEILMKVYDQKLSDRDMSIALYKGERRSLRKLGKLVLSLMKERVVNVFRRKKNRASDGVEAGLGTENVGGVHERKPFTDRAKVLVR